MNKPATDPPLLLSFAFRPLFLLVVLQALVGIALWSAWWAGLLVIDWPVNPIYWHGHEMISGFAGAAIGGFLLTAVATWCKRPPVQGWPLLILCLCWLGARLALVAPLLAAVAGVLWWGWLLALMARELLLSRNQRNYKVLLVLGVFTLTEGLYHFAAMQGLAWQGQMVWSQMWLVLILINLIGGRIIPAFTRNWLLQQQRPDANTPPPVPAEFGPIDVLATVALLLFAVISLLFVPLSLPGWVALLSGVAAALLQAWRLSRWQGHRTLSEPLVWILHVAYAWLPLGLLLLACGLAGKLPVSAGLHALTAGTIAGMIVSVSARAALGHTGRPLRSHVLVTLCFVLLTLASASRVLASVTGSALLMQSATLLWLLAFIAFGLRYAPILLRPAAKA